VTATGAAAPPRPGDVEGFAALVRSHDDDLRALVWSVVRDRWLMDDVLQAAYEKAFRGLGSFRGDSSVRTWLHRICYTTAIDALRHERRRRHESLDEPGALPGRGDPADGAVSRVDLARAWDALPADQRAALTLVAVHRMTYDEAAQVCRTRAGTVASRVSRARARLRELLAADPGPDPHRSTARSLR
jgi:RNA polymerase sigma-70 factor (ECF subfamily)